MPNNTDSDVSDTVRTTPSERKKAQLVKRCVINFLKCLRICKKTPNSTNSVWKNILMFSWQREASRFLRGTFRLPSLPSQNLRLLCCPTRRGRLHRFAVSCFLLFPATHLDSRLPNILEPRFPHNWRIWRATLFFFFHFKEGSLFISRFKRIIRLPSV